MVRQFSLFDILFSCISYCVYVFVFRELSFKQRMGDAMGVIGDGLCSLLQVGVRRQFFLQVSVERYYVEFYSEYVCGVYFYMYSFLLVRMLYYGFDDWFQIRYFLFFMVMEYSFLFFNLRFFYLVSLVFFLFWDIYRGYFRFFLEGRVK